MNGTGILRSPPGSSSSTAAEVAVVGDMKESCSQFWLLRFWKSMDPKGLSIWGERKKKMKKHKSVVNNAESYNNNNNGGKKNQSLLLRRQNASAKWQSAQIAQTGPRRRRRRRETLIAESVLRPFLVLEACLETLTTSGGYLRSLQAFGRADIASSNNRSQ